MFEGPCVRKTLAGNEPVRPYDALLRLSELILNETDLEELGYGASKILGEALGVSRVGYSAIDPDADTLHTTKDWCAPGVVSLAGALQLRDYGSFIDSLKRGEFISIADVRLDPRTSAAATSLEGASARSFVNVPVLEHGRLRAVMFVNDVETRAWSSDALSLVQEFARRTRTAIERLAAEAVNRAREAELHVLAERLQLEREHMRFTLHQTQVSAFNWDLISNTVQWTGNAPFGRDAAELTQPNTVFGLIHPEDRARVQQQVVEALAEKVNYGVEYRGIWPDNSEHWVRSSGVVMRNEQGDAVRMVGIDTDITDQKLATEAQLRTEKLAAVGRLASSIAHEINNPLESVTNLIYLVRSSAETSPETHEYMEIADRELRRVSNIASQTLRFHRQAASHGRCMAEKLFRESVSIYQGRLVNSQIEVVERHRASEEIDCFEGEIRQVLSNLIANAIDAMPFGGRLLLRSIPAMHPRLNVRGIALTVADTGIGMSAAVRDKVFEAFYSTKGIGGTGLGLWISKEIVDRHHGTLQVRSSQAAGRSGTVFRLFLPASPFGSLAMMDDTSSSRLVADLPLESVTS